MGAAPAVGCHRTAVGWGRFHPKTRTPVLPASCMVQVHEVAHLHVHSKATPAAGEMLVCGNYCENIALTIECCLFTVSLGLELSVVSRP